MVEGTALITEDLGSRYFGNDAAWFRENVPFFQCSNSELEEIYHYRWKLYKAHIRSLGDRGFVITEFLDDVGWQKHPYAMLNDATGFHIYEGRWMRDRRYLDGFLNFLYPGGGNDRHFAESIADAAHAYYLVHGDAKFATKHLEVMKHIYNLWDDHFDFDKGLYFIEPLLDATEYTVSSIDASGGKDGFRGGDAFRPTINSYMVANARAICHFCTLAGDEESARDYHQRAEKLKARVQESLWSESLGHFIDRYKVNNQHVKYWEPIRARELAGYVPWTHNLPDDEPRFKASWNHLLLSNEFSGEHGLRTIGPGYEYYMRQYRYLGKSPECQWNGPSWPFQTTQVLLGLANLLNNYGRSSMSRSDYLHLLRSYAKQHYLHGKPNLQEDYNPDTGEPIVGLDRSHHYNHSGFCDLIITGLCGLRPRTDNTLEINPLIPEEPGLDWFCLENVHYHGHLISVLWDRDGTKYKQGVGLRVFVDGKRVAEEKVPSKVTVPISHSVTKTKPASVDSAVNFYRHGYPMPSASSDPDKTLWQAVDGRAWFFPEMVRGWSPDVSAGESWFEIEYAKPTKLSQVRLSFYDDGSSTRVPDGFVIQSWTGSAWRDVVSSSGVLKGNTSTEVAIGGIEVTKLRAVFRHPAAMRLVEFATY